MPTPRGTIICPGPSANKSVIPSLHELGDVYVINRAMKLYDDYKDYEPNGIFAYDGPTKFARDEQYLFQNRIKKYTKHTSWSTFHRLKMLPCIPMKTAKCEDKNPFKCRHYVYPPVSSALLAWQFLVRQSYKEIYLYGWDGRFKDDPYFSKVRLLDEEIEQRRERYVEIIDGLKEWIPYAEERGCITYSLTPDSKLNEFLEYKNVEEALCQKRLRKQRDC